MAEETERIRLSNEVIGVIPSSGRPLTEARDSVVVLKRVFSDIRQNTQLLESDDHFNLELLKGLRNYLVHTLHKQCRQRLI